MAGAGSSGKSRTAPSKKRCGKFHDHWWIRRAVGRLHVGTPDEEVIDYLKSRLKPGVWETLSARDQRDFICEAIRQHRINQELYVRVMTGKF